MNSAVWEAEAEKVVRIKSAEASSQAPDRGPGRGESRRKLADAEASTARTAWARSPANNWPGMAP